MLSGCVMRGLCDLWRRCGDSDARRVKEGCLWVRSLPSDVVATAFDVLGSTLCGEAGKDDEKCALGIARRPPCASACCRHTAGAALRARRRAVSRGGRLTGAAPGSNARRVCAAKEGVGGKVVRKARVCKCGMARKDVCLVPRQALRARSRVKGGSP